MSTSTPDRLARRYGERAPGRAGRLSPGRAAGVAAAVIAVLGTAIVLWLTLPGSGSGASVTGSSYSVISDTQVRVAFSVVRDDVDVDLRCTVQALDASHAQVGVTLVDVPAGGAREVPLTVDVVTLARAEQGSAVDTGCTVVQP